MDMLVLYSTFGVVALIFYIWTQTPKGKRWVKNGGRMDSDNEQD